MGFEDVMLYEASWMEWGNKRYYYPVETAENKLPGGALPGATSASADSGKRRGSQSRSSDASEGRNDSKSGYISCGG
jgi:thiosulfate/3-mercaptopyruvate sulfurtransferase